jgi:hypothetical protein
MIGLRYDDALGEKYKGGDACDVHDRNPDDLDPKPKQVR